AGRIPKGKRAAMSGYSGGGKGLFLDYAAQQGLTLAQLSPETEAAIEPLIDVGLAPENPLDTGAGLAGRQEIFSQVTQLMAKDDGVDLICMQGQLPMAEGETPNPENFAAVARLGKPVVAHGRMAQNVTETGRTFQESAGMPFLLGLPETIHAMKALGEYGETQRRGIQPLAPAQSAGLNQAGLQSLLTGRQIPPPMSAFAATPGEAAKRAGEIGFPVALKIQASEDLHKTELGGVRLHLLNETAVEAAAGSMLERLEVEIEGFLVQEQVEGLELLIGLRQDPQFGPFMVVGLGGVEVEALRDIAFRLLPVSAGDGAEMLGESRAARLMEEFRGRPARDKDAVINSIQALSEIYLAGRDEIEDLEINPLIVGAEGQGVRAVDLRVIWK
ncbi:MAG: acetate--CoA ligase family protein, partial [Rhodospirillales bacterium]|nr:acetate--CoA ligase family protein [Rhodospirillales bacterium]